MCCSFVAPLLPLRGVSAVAHIDSFDPDRALIPAVPKLETTVWKGLWRRLIQTVCLETHASSHSLLIGLESFSAKA